MWHEMEFRFVEVWIWLVYRWHQVSAIFSNAFNEWINKLMYDVICNFLVCQFHTHLPCYFVCMLFVLRTFGVSVVVGPGCTIVSVEIYFVLRFQSYIFYERHVINLLEWYWHDSIRNQICSVNQSVELL